MIYLAYGSNMNIEQMAYRCPKAKLLDTAVLENDRLMFKRKRRPVATIEKVVSSVFPFSRLLFPSLALTDAALLIGEPPCMLKGSYRNQGGRRICGASQDSFLFWPGSSSEFLLSPLFRFCSCNTGYPQLFSLLRKF